MYFGDFNKPHQLELDVYIISVCVQHLTEQLAEGLESSPASPDSARYSCALCFSEKPRTKHMCAVRTSGRKIYLLQRGGGGYGGKRIGRLKKTYKINSQVSGERKSCKREIL